MVVGDHLGGARSPTVPLDRWCQSGPVGGSADASVRVTLSVASDFADQVGLAVQSCHWVVELTFRWYAISGTSVPHTNFLARSVAPPWEREPFLREVALSVVTYLKLPQLAGEEIIRIRSCTPPPHRWPAHCAARGSRDSRCESRGVGLQHGSCLMQRHEFLLRESPITQRLVSVLTGTGWWSSDGRPRPTEARRWTGLPNALQFNEHATRDVMRVEERFGHR